MVWSQLSGLLMSCLMKRSPKTPLLKENYRRRNQDVLKLTCTEKLKKEVLCWLGRTSVLLKTYWEAISKPRRWLREGNGALQAISKSLANLFLLGPQRFIFITRVYIPRCSERPLPPCFQPSSSFPPLVSFPLFLPSFPFSFYALIPFLFFFFLSLFSFFLSSFPPSHSQVTFFPADIRISNSQSFTKQQPIQ